MSELRAKPIDLCMSDAMPFSQHWEYKTTWPVEDLITDQFFLPVRSMLRSGDSITLCRFNSTDDRAKRLLEVVTVRVIASGSDAKTVPLLRIGDVFRVPEAKGVEPLEIKRGFAGKYSVKRGEDTVSEHGSKAEAEAALEALAA